MFKFYYLDDIVVDVTPPNLFFVYAMARKLEYAFFDFCDAVSVFLNSLAVNTRAHMPS